MAPDLNLSWEREGNEGERGRGGGEEEEPASIEKSSCIPEAPFALVAFQNDDRGEGRGRFKNMPANEFVLTARLTQSCVKIKHIFVCSFLGICNEILKCMDPNNTLCFDTVQESTFDQEMKENSNALLCSMKCCSSILL